MLKYGSLRVLLQNHLKHTLQWNFNFTFPDFVFLRVYALFDDDDDNNNNIKF
jgi:hypothetical protein